MSRTLSPRTAVSIGAFCVLFLSSCAGDPAPGPDEATEPAIATRAPVDDGSAEDAPQEKAESPSASSAPGTETNTPVTLNDEPVMAPAWAEVHETGYLWHGGLVGAAWTQTAEVQAGDDSAVTVAAWIPGHATMAECTVNPLVDGESTQALEVVGVEAEPGVIAAHLVYSTTAAASGLDPESDHTYVQPLDLDTCELGERIEVGTAASNASIVGLSGDVLALAVDEEGVVGGVSLGVSTISGESVWRMEGLGTPLPASGQSFASTVLVASNDDRDEKQVVDAGTGARIGSGSDFAPQNGVSIGEGRAVLVEEDVAHGDTSTLFAGGKTTTLGDKLTHHDTWVTLFDTEGAAVMVGTFGWPDGTLAWVGQDGALHEILPADQVADLDLELVGGSAGVIYARTTSETIAVTLDGEEVDASSYGVPLGERRVGDELWTLWEGDDGARTVAVSANSGA